MQLANVELLNILRNISYLANRELLKLKTYSKAYSKEDSWGSTKYLCCLDVTSKFTTSTVTFWPNQNVHCNILSMWHYDFLSFLDPIKMSKFFLSGLGFWINCHLLQNVHLFYLECDILCLWHFVLCFLILSMWTFCYIFFSLFALWHYASFSWMS